MLPKYPCGIHFYYPGERYIKSIVVSGITVTLKEIKYHFSDNASISQDDLDKGVEEKSYFLNEVDAKKALIERLKIAMDKSKKDYLEMIKREEKEIKNLLSNQK